MVDHGYQPLKPQMDEGELTLSILRIFDERAPVMLSLSYPVALARTMPASMRDIGFWSRSGCRTRRVRFQ